jgi:mono/diheme cytochrome c family protein
VAYQPKQNRNVRTVLGEPRVQLVVYTVWFSGIIIGAILLFFLGFLVAGDYNGRTQQTAREAAGPAYAKIPLTADGTKIEYVEAWKTQGTQGEEALKSALAQGQANFNRICVGCHYGPPTITSIGAWLGDLYQTATLYNGTPVNDANVVRFILLGHGNMPSGIPLPQQAVNIMLYLKQQTSGTPTK